MAKKIKPDQLPKLVTVEKELLDQLLLIVGSMPIMDAQKAVKAANKESWSPKDSETTKIIPLSVLDNLAGYLRILPLYQSGELYTMMQMSVKAYGEEEAVKEVVKEDDLKADPELAKAAEAVVGEKLPEAVMTEECGNMSEPQTDDPSKKLKVVKKKK